MFGDNAKDSSLFIKDDSSFSFTGEFINKDALCLDKGSDILVFKGFATSEFCKKFISYFDKQNKWAKSVTYGEMEFSISPESSPRQSMQINLLEYKCADKYAFDIFTTGLSKVREKYSHLNISSDEGYSLLRYTGGGEYKSHIDHGPSNNRVLSGLIYLNDNYEGGEIYFDTKDIKIKPEEGDVVFFPSGYTHSHASLPVTKGIKYAIVTWFR